MTGEEQGVWSLGLILVSAGITFACILVGRTLHKLALTLLIVVGVWAVIWSVGVGLHDSDWHNITGWVDCHTCTAWHVVGGWLFFGPPVAIAVAVVATAVVTAIDRL